MGAVGWLLLAFVSTAAFGLFMMAIAYALSHAWPRAWYAKVVVGTVAVVCWLAGGGLVLLLWRNVLVSFGWLR